MVEQLSSEQVVIGSNPILSKDLYNLIGKILHCECSNIGSIPVRDINLMVVI